MGSGRGRATGACDGAPACGTAAPAAEGATGWDASTTAYAAQWSYSTGGRITSLVKGAAGAPTTSTYTYTDTAHPAAVTQVAGGATTDSFGYDTAGRMVSRTVNGVATALTWDVTSSLVDSNGQGGHVVYAYDASGQRVVQARVADANGVGTATAYVASGQVDDSDTAVAGGVTATRYYTFGGSTVAIRTNDGQLSLMLGDEQGSTNVMMPVHVVADANGTSAHLAPATLADAAASTRTSYTPYGQLRGADNLATDRGWLGQVEDRVVGTGASSTGTGLTYLNARYYDPATSRFISPDPLMNPGDPKTLDPYRYADNNPVVFTDATGLAACSGLSVADEKTCMTSFKQGMGYVDSTAHQGVGLKQEAPQAPAKPKASMPSIGLGGIGGVAPIGGVPPIGTGGGGPTACTGWLSGAGCGNTVLQKGIDWITGWIDNGGLRKNGYYNTPAGTSKLWKSAKRLLLGSTGRKATTAVSHLDVIGSGMWLVGTVASGLDAYNHLEDIGVRDKMPLWDVAYNVVGRTATGALFGAVAEGTVAVAALPDALGAGLIGCGEGVVVCGPLLDIAVASGAAIVGDMGGTMFWDFTADERLKKQYGSG